MEKKSKKTIIISSAILVLVTLTLLGLTYAYYRTRIVGNPNDESISVTSKMLELTYADKTANIVADGIEPGYTNTKTFTVKNTGNATLEKYVVALDDVVNTFTRAEDWTYKLTCTSKNEAGEVSGTCAGSEGTYPTGDTVIAVNSIDEKITHEYVLTITYADLKDVDQSEDMGKELSGRLDIRDADSANPFVGNKESLAYNIVANAMVGINGTIYRETPLTVPGVKPTYNALGEAELSNGTKLFMNGDSEFQYSDSFSVNSETEGETLDNPQTVKYSDIYSTLAGKYVSNITGTNNAGQTVTYPNVWYISSANEEFLVYHYVNPIDGSHEATLSVTEDDYGTSYYFRGNTEDNYVNFNGMCFRIVRIEGDGAIKLVLADATNECANINTKADANNISAFIGTAAYGHTTTNYDNVLTVQTDAADYVNSSNGARSMLNQWYSDNFADVNNLVKQDTKWCFGNTTNLYEKDVPDHEYLISEFSDQGVTTQQELKDYFRKNNKRYYYSKRYTVDREYNMVNLSLMCNGSGDTYDNNNIGMLTADEIGFAGATAYGSINKSYYLYLGAGVDQPAMLTLTQTGLYTANSKYPNNYEGVYRIINGGITTGSIIDEMYLRPSISLISGVEIESGNGTQTNPYVIKAS